jgi:Tfp pilus assembly protein PilV
MFVCLRSHALLEGGVTILEVLASAVLILLGLGAVFSMNTHSLQILRKTHQASASSQILQERIEILRTRPWPEVSRSRAVATWWGLPTHSAPDLADADPTETITVSAASTPGVGSSRTESFVVERRGKRVQVLRDADFASERLLVVELQISWRERQRTQERRVRTILGRAGLTQSGIFGSAFGRVQSDPAAQPSQ